VEQLGNPEFLPRFFRALKQLMTDGLDTGKQQKLRNRVLYGSDWIMLAKEVVSDQYLETIASAYKQAFGAAARHRFTGANALEFLGLQDGQNRERLTRYYIQWGLDTPAWFAQAK
jgi:hypothetical protein